MINAKIVQKMPYKLPYDAKYSTQLKGIFFEGPFPKVCFFIRKYLQNHLTHKIHIFCPIEINVNFNFVCQMVLQVFSYKKQTLVNLRRDKYVQHLVRLTSPTGYLVFSLND